MMFADLTLSKRLERAEAHACAKFAEARRQAAPGSGAEWMECAGAYAVFDTVDSPVTQCFGLGIFEPVTPAVLDEIEAFFRTRGAAVDIELSPLAGVAALDLLCSRGYRPVEISSVLYQPVQMPARTASGIHVRIIGADEADLWATVSARGWAAGQPTLEAFVRGFGGIMAARQDGVCFLAAIDGEPGAAGALSIHEGVALFAGAATVPELRQRGLQAALLQARMQYAADHGCDVAMMAAEAGSGSQRNAERQGFRIAYTRTKWRLTAPAATAP
jgi:GNAT superfamily N-acetyltransferase